MHSRWKQSIAAVVTTLAGLVLATGGPAADRNGGPTAGGPWPAQDLAFLRDLARDVVRASALKPGDRVGNSPMNTAGFSLYMPGGQTGYSAFWIRDFAMSLDSGLFTAAEISNHLVFEAAAQNGAAPRPLRHGLTVPPFAIPDHINFDGGAVFYPGTYSATEDQGDGTFGQLPPVDDQYEFVHTAYALFQTTGDARFLATEINGRSLLDRLTNAFAAPEVDATSELVSTTANQRAVGFGFYDGVYFTGQVLFPSLLRYQAAGELSRLCAALGKQDEAANYRRLQTRIAQEIEATFGASPRLRGWLQAATGIGGQADVWGTLFALHLGVLDGDGTRRATVAVLDGVRRGTIVAEAAVRHVPADMDYATNSAWERTVGIRVNTYQNGAYWHTATGWLIEAVDRADASLARRLFADYVTHLRRQDFRLGPGHEAPWECFHPASGGQNGVYMTSVTLPYAVLSAGWRPTTPP